MDQAPDPYRPGYRTVRVRNLMEYRRKLRVLGHLVRQILLEVYPEQQSLEGRCYTASALLFNAISGLEPSLQPTLQDGWILPPGEQKCALKNNHAWITLTLDHRPYVLDATLSQFEAHLGRRVPQVVLLPVALADHLFYYQCPVPTTRWVARALYATMWMRITLEPRLGWAHEEAYL